MMRKVRIAEIFGPTIQGEGALIGKPTVFVRTGGCDYRCSWCDTLHAVDSAYRHEWTPMTAVDIFDEIQKLSGHQPLTVSLSGGNPAIAPLSPLIELGHEKGYTFALETQGSVCQEWFKNLDVLTLSPKPPSSLMETNWGKLDDCVNAAGPNTEIALKIVVFDDLDFAYAKDVSARYPALALYLQPGNHTPPPPEAENAPIDLEGIGERYEWLIDRVMQDKWYRASVLPQLHVMVWGNKRGV
jgi:7-carboxy-7-deazaguanine synthase